MTSQFNGDFASLVPSNHVAQVLFSDMVVYSEEKDTFHLKFIRRTSGEPEPACSEPVEESTDYDTQSETDPQILPSNSIQNFGNFVLSLNSTHSPEFPRLGWRVGKGTSRSVVHRGVDMLLTRPGHLSSKSLASIHMIFRFNQQSGFLMLVSGSGKTSIDFKIDGVWEKLKLDEEQLMYQQVTMLRAGTCEYELSYTVTQENKEAFFNQRNDLFGKIQDRDIYTRPSFQKLPGDTCVLRGKYLEYGTQGAGAFGWISQAINTKTGDLIAIKELRLNSRRDNTDVVAEVEMGRRFLNQRGLLPIHEAWCEHGHPNGCSGSLEKFFIFMPYARSDFCFDLWTQPDVHRQNKLSWLREPLEAMLCDYGKAVEAATSTVTTIGPIHTLAPEVWSVSLDGPYTSKIDMWAYGYAVAGILGYSMAKHPGLDGYHSNPRITRNRHSAILEMLSAHRERANEDRPLVDLCMKLLAWSPGERWSADQALQHQCWNPITEEHERHKGMIDEESVDVKRAKRIHPVPSISDSGDEALQLSSGPMDKLLGRHVR